MEGGKGKDGRRDKDVGGKDKRFRGKGEWGVEEYGNARGQNRTMGGKIKEIERRLEKKEGEERKRKRYR